jgi:hypothetical protein
MKKPKKKTCKARSRKNNFTVSTIEICTANET